MTNFYRLMMAMLIAVVLVPVSYAARNYVKPKGRQEVKYDREYTLEATMLGYMGTDGKRNPTLKVSKGELVRIKIVNGEMMTHDIALEKAKVKSKGLVQKGDTSSVVFKATTNDVYYCTVPGHRAAGMVGKIEVVTGPITKVVTIAGIVPTKAGKTLNLGFESGTFKDWTIGGEIFSVVGRDASAVYEKDVVPGAYGKYFLSSGGTKDYKRKGTLTSVSFTVTHPFASFLVSGGALQDDRIEIVQASTKKVIFQITGSGRPNLQPVVVDLKKYLNQQIFIRVIDNETGVSQIPYIGDDRMAHINFDDFRFYKVRPNFSNELKSSDIIILPPLDPVINAGLSGIEAAKAMSPKKGFTVKLAAAEPDIVRPISFTIDARGRLWVAEAHTYPVRAAEGQGQDRILIMEDTDGDGTLDKKTVFMEGLNLVSGLEVGMGGVWVGAAPNLLFIPWDDKQEKATGPAQVVLDGWGYEDTHETLNSLRWGPDGWLYGTHGVFTQSNVGFPGAPDSERTRVNAGVWRYHPTKKKFELFAEGTSNPWGIDFNDYGHAFITACVIPHMFQMIQGARYLRQGGNHFNPYTYDDIKQVGDHVHWIGDRGPHAGNFRSASAGGGHAHAGAMIYLGSDKWPAEYRNNIFMNNIHGARVNMDIPKRLGSGYTVSHGQDFLLTNDSWSQWLNFRYDASGSVFAIDWYDKNQCHSPNPDVHQKTMGRIFKISHETDKWVKVNLWNASDAELVAYQLNTNEYFVRQARQILQERGPNPKVHAALREILDANPDVTRKLRALWALHVTQGLQEKDLLALLDQPSEYIRSWAIQLLAEDKNVSDMALARFAQLAASDPSALVRLYLSSALLRTEPAKRGPVLAALLKHDEDKDDHNLPLMYWYVLEPTVPLDASKAIDLAVATKIPKILQYTAQRTAAVNSPASKDSLKELKERLEKTGDHHQYHEVLMVIDKALNKISR
jgi:putative membrane-bound dehydrogenase-like protein